MADAGCRGGHGGRNWAQASSTAFSLLRHSLHVMKITVANPPPGATPHLPEPRIKLRMRASVHQSRARRTTQFQHHDPSHHRHRRQR